MSTQRAVAMAFSRKGEPSIGEFADAVMLEQFEEAPTPNELPSAA